MTSIHNISYTSTESGRITYDLDSVVDEQSYENDKDLKYDRMVARQRTNYISENGARISRFENENVTE